MTPQDPLSLSNQQPATTTTTTTAATTTTATTTQLYDEGYNDEAFGGIGGGRALYDEGYNDEGGVNGGLPYNDYAGGVLLDVKDLPTTTATTTGSSTTTTTTTTQLYDEGYNDEAFGGIGGRK